MLDIREIREHPAAVRARLQARSGDHWKLIDEVLACDETRRAAETEKQNLQAQRKQSSKQIGILKGQGQDSSAIEAEVRAINDRITAFDAAAEAAAARQADLLLNIPNLPHAACPPGSDESANPVVREWGAKPDLTDPKDHLALAEALGLFSLDDATRIAGSGFAVYRGRRAGAGRRRDDNLHRGP